MTIGTLNIKARNETETPIYRDVKNTAIDGSMYAYRFGSRKQMTLEADITFDEKVQLEEVVKEVVTVVFDTGEKINAIVTPTFQRFKTLLGWRYTAFITIEEAVKI